MSVRFHTLICTLVWCACSACTPDVDNRAPRDPIELEDSTLDVELDALLAELVESVRASPADAQAHARLGFAYEANDLFAEAEACYANASDLDPTNWQWLYREAVARRGRCDLSGALTSVQRAVALEPDEPRIWIRLGDWLQQAGQIDEARSAFARSEDMAPWLVDALLRWARVRLADGDAAGAARLAQEAAALDPGNAAARHVLGRAFVALGHVARGVALLESSTVREIVHQNDPHAVELKSYRVGRDDRLARIRSLVASGELDTAARAAQELVDRRGSDPTVLEAAAEVAIGRGEPARALALLERSLQIDPARVRSQLLTAACLVQVGRDTQARESVSAALAAAPQVGEGHYLRAILSWNEGDFAGALEAARTALGLGYDKPGIFPLVAQLYGSLGQNDAMLRYAEVTARKLPDDLRSHLLLAQARATSGDSAGANDALDDATRLAPDSPDVAALRAALSNQDGR